MKTAISAFIMLTFATPVFAAPYCQYQKQLPGTGNSLMTEFVTNNCKLTKEQRRQKAECDTIKEEDRPRSCWALYKDK